MGSTDGEWQGAVDRAENAVSRVVPDVLAGQPVGAYQSNESGQYEVYVRPFIWVGTAGAATEGQWQVSTSGGIHPVWGPNGKELYHLDPTGAMMAASITPKGPHLDVGTPVRLFAADIVGGGGDAQQRRQYDVGPDGRFLINTIVEDISTPITLLMNWRPPTP